MKTGWMVWISTSRFRLIEEVRKEKEKEKCSPYIRCEKNNNRGYVVLPSAWPYSLAVLPHASREPHCDVWCCRLSSDIAARRDPEISSSLIARLITQRFVSDTGSLPRLSCHIRPEKYLFAEFRNPEARRLLSLQLLRLVARNSSR